MSTKTMPTTRPTYREEFRPVTDQFRAIRERIEAMSNGAAYKKEPVVAILDTGVWHNHPNLADGIDVELMADFSLHDEGQRPFG